MTSQTMYMVVYLDTYHTFKNHLKSDNYIGCVVHTSTDSKACKRMARKLYRARWNTYGKLDRYYLVKAVTNHTFTVPVYNF